jgi:hypothetical protein
VEIKHHLEELLRVWPERFARQGGPLRPVVERALRVVLRATPPTLLAHLGTPHRKDLPDRSARLRGRSSTPSSTRRVSPRRRPFRRAAGRGRWAATNAAATNAADSLLTFFDVGSGPNATSGAGTGTRLWLAWHVTMTTSREGADETHDRRPRRLSASLFSPYHRASPPAERMLPEEVVPGRPHRRWGGTP